MTFEQCVAQAEEKWQSFIKEWQSFEQKDSLQAYGVFLSQAVAQRKIDRVELEPTGRESFTFTPRPIQIVPSHFLIEPPKTIFAKAKSFLFRSEYRRIQEAEAQLKEMNAAFEAHLDAKYSPEQLQAMVRSKLGFKQCGTQV